MKLVSTHTKLRKTHVTLLLRRDFLPFHGPEELSGVDSSPAVAAGQVVGKT